MAEEGLIVPILLGKRKLTSRGALLDLLVFAAITTLAGFFFGLGVNASNIALRSSLRHIDYENPFLLPPALTKEVSGAP